MKHRETHPDLNVEGCFGCRVAGVRMGTNTTTSRGARVAEVNQTERNWNKDMPAYKRLRANGLQPKKIDGSAEVEKKAQESWQVETGILPNI
jgi:hypothetical protein